VDRHRRDPSCTDGHTTDTHRHDDTPAAGAESANRRSMGVSVEPEGGFEPPTCRLRAPLRPSDQPEPAGLGLLGWDSASEWSASLGAVRSGGMTPGMTSGRWQRRAGQGWAIQTALFERAAQPYAREGQRNWSTTLEGRSPHGPGQRPVHGDRCRRRLQQPSLRALVAGRTRSRRGKVGP